MSSPVPEQLRAARDTFVALIEDLRPQLHRYCARMVGSAIDGEDVLQETLAQAYYSLSMMTEVPRLRPWLFRIAHNKAVDHLRAGARRASEPLEEEAVAAREEQPPIEQREDAAAALSFYMELTPIQRSAVILKDVLGASLVEAGEILDASVPAIKAALHRGRRRLRSVVEAAGVDQAPPGPRDSARVALLTRYVELFNARDWEALRATLARDARLDLVGRFQRSGAAEVGEYFTNYDKLSECRLTVGTLDGGDVVVANDAGDAVAAGQPPHAARYPVLVEFDEAGQVRSIRDFRYVPYDTLGAR